MQNVKRHICILVLTICAVGIRAQSQTRLIEESKKLSIKYSDLRNPFFWNLDLQKGVYKTLFNCADFKQVTAFIEFIKSLAKYNDMESVYQYNPVILAIEERNFDIYRKLFEYDKTLFYWGNINEGYYDLCPEVVAVQSYDVRFIKFIFDMRIDEGKIRYMYGDSDVGREKYIARNLLTYARNEEIVSFLLANKIPATILLMDEISLTVKIEKLNIFSSRTTNSAIVGSAKNGDIIIGDEVTSMKYDGVQWCHIKTKNGIAGWVKVDFFAFEYTYSG